MFGQIGATHTKLCRSHNQEGKRQLTLVCAEKRKKELTLNCAETSREEKADEGGSN